MSGSQLVRLRAIGHLQCPRLSVSLLPYQHLLFEKRFERLHQIQGPALSLVIEPLTQLRLLCMFSVRLMGKSMDVSMLITCCEASNDGSRLLSIERAE